MKRTYKYNSVIKKCLISQKINFDPKSANTVCTFDLASYKDIPMTPKKNSQITKIALSDKNRQIITKKTLYKEIASLIEKSKQFGAKFPDKEIVAPLARQLSWSNFRISHSSRR